MARMSTDFQGLGVQPDTVTITTEEIDLFVRTCLIQNFKVGAFFPQASTPAETDNCSWVRCVASCYSLAHLVGRFNTFKVQTLTHHGPRLKMCMRVP